MELKGNNSTKNDVINPIVSLYYTDNRYFFLQKHVFLTVNGMECLEKPIFLNNLQL